MEQYLAYAGRILFGGYFVFNAINHFFNVKAMAGYSQSKGIPMPTSSVIGSGLLLLGGGVSILFDMYTGIGPWLLVAFLIPVSFTMHAFWRIQDPMVKMSEMVNFTKNMSLLGAVLVMMSGSAFVG